MLTIEERIQNIQTILTQLVDDTKKLANDDEIDAVVAQIFGSIDDLKNRISVIKNNLAIVKEIIV